MLDKSDSNGDSPLHFACRVANIEVINYLVGDESGTSISETNADNKLPVHLLLQCENEKVDRESAEYIGACWHLFRAYPEAVIHRRA